MELGGTQNYKCNRSSWAGNCNTAPELLVLISSYINGKKKRAVLGPDTDSFGMPRYSSVNLGPPFATQANTSTDLQEMGYSKL